MEKLPEEKFYNKIKNLNPDQTVFFAWLCSIRALPFMGSTGRFIFWGKDKNNQYLYSVLNAIEAKDLESKGEVKQRGLLVRLGNFIDDLDDKDSRTYKVISGIKNGVKIALKIATAYNAIAQWAGLPQVPGPFLGVHG